MWTGPVSSIVPSYPLRSAEAEQIQRAVALEQLNILQTVVLTATHEQCDAL
jgi:hypothetical protein